MSQTDHLSSELCRDSFSGDDFTPEDLDNEIAVILVQLGFVYQLQGKHDDAMKLYTTALKSKYVPLPLLHRHSQETVMSLLSFFLLRSNPGHPMTWCLQLLLTTLSP